METPPAGSLDRSRQWEALKVVIESIGSGLALQPLLTRILELASELIGAPYGSIGLHDEADAAFVTAAVHGLPQGEIGKRMPAGVGLAGQILLTREAVCLERYGDVPEPTWPELAEHAVVGVPILWEGRLVGFLGMGAPPPRAFGPKDVETLMLFGRHAAIAIENARRIAGEKRRSMRLAVVARVGHMITGNLALEDLLQRAMNGLHDLLGCQAAAVALRDAETPGLLVIRAVAGLYRGVVSPGLRLPVSQGIMGRAVREARPLVVNNVGADPDYYPTPGLSGIRAELAIPLALAGEVLGVLVVEGADAFSDDDAASLEIVADHLAVSIRNARLFESEHERTRRLALIARIGQIITSGLGLEAQLQTSADAIHELFGYPNVDIPVLDGNALVIRARGGHYKQAIPFEDRLPVDRGIMGAAVRHRRTELVPDVSRDRRYVVPPTAAGRIRAELAVPIVLGEEVLGVVNVESDGTLDGHDATILELVADYLAVAISNARLHERAQEVAVLEERHRLARDLHDSVTQLLFSVTLIAQSVGPAFRRDAAEGEKQVRRLLDLTRSALAEMRALLTELRPLEPAPGEPDGAGPAEGGGLATLRRQGLPRALRGYADQISGGALKVEVEAASYAAQPLEREEVLYRVAQEALSNVVRHSRGKTARVRLSSAEAGGVTLLVEDDGDGFDSEGARERLEAGPLGGFGLISMRERVEALGGILRIESSPGVGSAVSVELPSRTPA